MPISISTYSGDDYNSLPELRAAQADFESKTGKRFVYEVLRPLLFKHYMQKYFGVALLHKHFDLDKDEQLVEINDVASAWKVKTDTRDLARFVVPSTWKIKQGKNGANFTPIEFEFEAQGARPHNDLTDADAQSFLEDYANSVCNGGLETCLGLTTRHKRSAGIEVTEGKTNVFFPNCVDFEGGTNNVAAAWYFDQDQEGLD